MKTDFLFVRYVQLLGKFQNDAGDAFDSNVLI